MKKWLFLLLILTTLDDSYAKEAQPFSDILTISQYFLNKTSVWIIHHRKPPLETKLEFSAPIIVTGFLCFIAAYISSAGGIGGGGLFMPILIIAAGLDLKTASSLSAIMAAGALIANVGCNLAAAMPRLGGKTLVDFDIALLSQPFMLLGVSVGVICNVMFPEWLITILFAVFLAWSSTKTFRTGVKRWRQETEEQRSGDSENGLVLGMEVGDGEGESEGVVKSSVKESVSGTDQLGKCQSGLPWMKLGVLVLVWCSFCLLYVIRDNRFGEGIASIEPCGVGYWLLSAFQIPLALVYTALILRRKESSQNQNSNRRDITEDQTQAGQSKLLFPVMALLTGILGGLFGIAGGMLISAILLHFGVPPEVTAATCSFMVFSSATMSGFQYLLLGMEHTDVALVFAAICFVASFLGLIVVQKAIQKYGRTSLIIFSIGIVMALSTVLMTGIGALDVWRDYISGAYMGFKLPC